MRPTPAARDDRDKVDFVKAGCILDVSCADRFSREDLSIEKGLV